MAAVVMVTMKVKNIFLSEVMKIHRNDPWDVQMCLQV